MTLGFDSQLDKNHQNIMKINYIYRAYVDKSRYYQVWLSCAPKNMANIFCYFIEKSTIKRGFLKKIKNRASHL